MYFKTALFCHTTECHVTVMCSSPLSMAVSVLWIVELWIVDLDHTGSSQGGSWILC